MKDTAEAVITTFVASKRLRRGGQPDPAVPGISRFTLARSPASTVSTFSTAAPSAPSYRQVVGGLSLLSRAVPSQVPASEGEGS